MYYLGYGTRQQDFIKKTCHHSSKKRFLYSEIASNLGIARSTAYEWTKSTSLTMKEKELVEKNLRLKKSDNIFQMALINKKIRTDILKHQKKEAQNLVSHANLDAKSKIIICSIFFWCEGGKNTSNGVRFINSDPLMIKTFLSLLREVYDIDENKIRILMHLHSYHDEVKQKDFWSKITNVPKKQFYKTYQKSNSGKNIHPDYQGCISVRYSDAKLGNLLKMIYSEFGNIYRGVR